MLNKKYRLATAVEFGKHNPVYDKLVGSVCYLSFFEVGEPAWFMYETDIQGEPPRRVCTSNIKSVAYPDEHTVVVTTRNTCMTFEEVTE